MTCNVENLVVGAGAIGICCAHYLRRQGRDVMVIEKGDVCSGASYGNAGLIVPSYSIPLAAPGVISQAVKWLANAESPFCIRPSLRLSFLRWMLSFMGACNAGNVRRSIPVLRDMTRESLRLFREMSRLEGVDFGLEEKGRDLKIKLMIEPAKGYSITFGRPKPCVDVPISLAEAKVVITPMGETLPFAGTLELSGFDESINYRRVKAILKAVREYLPDLDFRGLELKEVWKGLRPCSPDGLPFIGRPNAYRNVVVASGHGMLGISLAPATGKLVSEIVVGGKPFMDMTALRIERFH